MSEPLSYLSAGVNIDAGNELVNRIKKIVPITHRKGVLGGIGGFGGCFDLSQLKHYKHPVLVSGTDGVGTKLRLAIQLQNHHTIGIDLVAMCVNDLVVMGAEPLFFLDYYATGKLELEVAESVIKGIAQGCQQAQVALLGGETAEMPGMYGADDYDLAGFCVGIVEKEEIIDGRSIKPGDLLIALASSGVHSNGYSLVHHIINTKKLPIHSTFLKDKPLAEVLLTPTTIYVNSVLALARAKILKGAAHITGGGFENIPRILPDDCTAFIDCASWQLPPIFAWLQKEGQLALSELRRTFNCGVGMVLCVDKENAAQALDLLAQKGEQAWILGEVIPRAQPEQGVEFSDGN